jgi:mevalonate pyrophosphate decarboxylase
MKEFIYSRNAVYETLRAKRREVFKLEIADNVQVKGKMAEIMALASQMKIPVSKRNAHNWTRSTSTIRASWRRSVRIRTVT